MLAPIEVEEAEVQDIGIPEITWIEVAPAPTKEAGVLPEPGALVFGEAAED